MENDSKPRQRISFETCLERLEETVHELESGQVSLADSLKKYEQGVKHLKRCYDLLQRAEKRIELLSGMDAEGNPQTVRFDEAEMTLEEKAESRSRRRTKRAAKKAREVPNGDTSEIESDVDIDDSPTLF